MGRTWWFGAVLLMVGISPLAPRTGGAARGADEAGQERVQLAKLD